MNYIVKTFRAAGLEAKWIKTSAGKPVIVARKPTTQEWYMVDRSMFEEMKKEGVLPAFERHTLLGDIFSLPV